MTEVAEPVARSLGMWPVETSGPQPEGTTSTRPTLRRIVEFTALPENWDGYGAAPIAAQAVAQSCALIEDVADLSFGLVGQRTAPWTSAPISDGGIQIEWLGSHQRIEVQVAADGTLGYLIERGAGESADYEEGEAVSQELVVELILSIVALAPSR